MTLGNPYVVEAFGYLKSLDGGSNPHVLVGQDGHAYVVKFKANTQSNIRPHLLLSNEWVANRIGTLIGAPLPEAVLLQTSDQFLLEHPAIARYASGAGLQFAYRFYPQARPVQPTTEEMRGIANLRDLPSAVALCAWLRNDDVKWEHILRADSRFYLCDFGHSQNGSPGRMPEDLAQNRVIDMLGPHTPFTEMARLASHVGVGFDFRPILKRAEDVNRATLKLILRSLPDEWGVSEDEKNEWVEYLLARLGTLPAFVERAVVLWRSLGIEVS